MDKEIEALDKKFMKNGFIVFIVGIILIVISPILLTRDFGWLNFSKTGEIGDTIGGLTSPIIGLIGAVLIFLSFREQWLANKMQVETIKKNKEDQLKTERLELVWRLYSEIKNDLMDNKVSEYNEQILKKGYLSYHDCSSFFFILNQIMNNLKLLLIVFKGMNEGRIGKDYSSIFIYKFDIIIGTIEPFQKANINEEIKPNFAKQYNELIKLQNELKELKWE